MPSFNYVVKDRSGRTSQGVMEAASMGEVATKLRQDNLFVVQINPVGQRSRSVSRKGDINSEKNRGRVALKDKLFFVKQFYVMLKAGLGMIVCLNNLYAQTENKYLRYIISGVRKDVEGGMALSAALGKFPKVFEKLFIHMLEAGEASGKLEVSLERLHGYYEQEYNLRKKVIGALTYPAIIAIVAVGVVVALMTFVLPIFADIFTSSGVQLPFLTRALLATSNFIRQFWYIIVLFIVALVFGYNYTAQNPKGQEVLDKFWLGVPVIGDLIRKLVTARFSRTLATLIDSGVPLLQSLEIVGRAVSNAVIAKGIQSAAIGVNRGTGLAQPLQDSGIFPTMVSQMITIGEETGELGHMLDEVASYYDKEVEYALESLTSMIEPAIIVFLGGVVGCIVAAIFIPLLEMSTGGTL
jgi:type IV pilus assembly protein PilC